MRAGIITNFTSLPSEMEKLLNPAFKEWIEHGTAERPVAPK